MACNPANHHSLRYYLDNYRITEEQTSNVPFTTLEFFVASIFQAVSCVHQLGFVHNDICPENLVFDSNGYLMLTGFGSVTSKTDELPDKNY